MKQEDKQLLLVDLCARLPYNFVYLYTNAPLAENKQIILTPVVISNLMNATEDLVLKPYLRLMSSMTEEEEIFYNIKYPYIKNHEQVDWLNSHHFDYRELIAKGLALEAPEGMYK